jgi:hypothetical protein
MMEIRRRVLVYEAYNCNRRRLADILCYRIAFACKDQPADVAKRTLNNYIYDILAWGVDKVYPDCFVDRWELYLTGKGNFREKIATTAVYKGNRLNTPKPEHHGALRDHLVQEWNAVIIQGQEADDAIATRATTLGDDCVIVSLDKDLDQVAGYHYNFVKKEAYYITPEEGLLRFYCQILTGDAADNIMGIHGIGNVKARKMLQDAEDEAEMYRICVEAYDGSEDRVIENARLLWLRRTEDEQLWNPPSNQTT